MPPKTDEPAPAKGTVLVRPKRGESKEDALARMAAVHPATELVFMPEAAGPSGAGRGGGGRGGRDGGRGGRGPPRASRRDDGPPSGPPGGSEFFLGPRIFTTPPGRGSERPSLPTGEVEAALRSAFEAPTVASELPEYRLPSTEHGLTALADSVYHGMCNKARDLPAHLTMAEHRTYCYLLLKAAKVVSGSSRRQPGLNLADARDFLTEVGDVTVPAMIAEYYARLMPRKADGVTYYVPFEPYDGGGPVGNHTYVVDFNLLWELVADDYAQNHANWDVRQLVLGDDPTHRVGGARPDAQQRAQVQQVAPDAVSFLGGELLWSNTLARKVRGAFHYLDANARGDKIRFTELRFGEMATTPPQPVEAPIAVLISANREEGAVRSKRTFKQSDILLDSLFGLFEERPVNLTPNGIGDPGLRAAAPEFFAARSAPFRISLRNRQTTLYRLALNV